MVVRVELADHQGAMVDLVEVALLGIQVRVAVAILVAGQARINHPELILVVVVDPIT
jgi:hypothetical protein